MAADYTNIGLVYHKKGQYDDALTYHNKALEIHEELNNRVGMAADYTNMGIVYHIKGQYDDALTYYNKGLEIDEELTDRVGMAVDYTNIGYLHLAKKDKEKAKEAGRNVSRVKDEFERDTGTEHPLKNRIDKLLSSINELDD